MNREGAYAVQCWHCLAEFDAADSVWCSCSASHPTKLCPFCLACFCTASAEYQESFWRSAPASIAAERETLASKRMLLGDLLVASNRITTDQLVAALRRQAQEGVKLGACLLEMGLLTPDELELFLAQQHAPVSLDLRSRRIDRELVLKIGITVCLRHRILPVERDELNGRALILLAMADASNVAAIDHVQSVLGAQVLPAAAREDEILRCLADMDPDQVLGTARDADMRPGLHLLERAIRSRASHLELAVTPAGGRACVRIDGVLYRLQETGARLEERHLDDLLAWRDEAAAAAGTHPVLEVEGVPWQVSITLSRHDEGRNLAVRIHHPEEPLQTLASTSLAAGEREVIHAALSAPHGLILVAGPPHSGTDLTLWALANAARSLNRPVLVDGAPIPHPDPEVPDLRQVHDGTLVQPAVLAARSADAGRALLVFAGTEEGRLEAAAALARQRLVLVEVAARDASEALDVFRRRCAAETPDPEQVRLALTQRCVRRICDRCFAPAGLSPRTLQRFGLTVSESLEASPLQGTGCDACHPAPGYRGREVILEIHPASSALRQGQDPASKEPVVSACRTLRASCLDLLARGLTSIEEFQKLNLPPPASAPAPLLSDPVPPAPRF